MKKPLLFGMLSLIPACGLAQSIVCAGKIINAGIWTYNFGPNKLMERIRFENGIVIRVDALGYGF